MGTEKYNVTKLYEATNGGFDIIRKHYPESVSCRPYNSNRFKFRANEKKASAYLISLSNWQIVDGELGQFYTPIDAVIMRYGTKRLETIKRLFKEFNVSP